MKLVVCKLKVVFLIIVVEIGGLVPTISTADGNDLVAVLRSDRVGAVADLKYLVLVKCCIRALRMALALPLEMFS